MKRRVRLGVVLSVLWMANAGGAALAQECPPGTIKVGEKEEETPTEIIVHPVCRKEAPPVSPRSTRPQFSLLAVHSQGVVVLTTSDGRKIPGADAAKFPLDTGTRVVTGPTGRLQMVLPDETIFTIGPNSDMIIDEFVWDPATSASATTARLIKGVFRFVTGKVVRKGAENIKVKLPIGDLGFRGTDAECALKPDGSGSIKLFSGKVVLTPANGGTTIALGPRLMIAFDSSGHISAPLPIGP